MFLLECFSSNSPFRHPCTVKAIRALHASIGYQSKTLSKFSFIRGSILWRQKGLHFFILSRMFCKGLLTHPDYSGRLYRLIIQAGCTSWLNRLIIRTDDKNKLYRLNIRADVTGWIYGLTGWSCRFSKLGPVGGLAWFSILWWFAPATFIAACSDL